MDWQFWSFKVWNTSVHALAFMDHIKKSAVILLGLSWSVAWLFYSFQCILFLISVQCCVSALTIMMRGVSFLLLPVWCLICLLYMVGFCPPGFREFSSMILLKILSMAFFMKIFFVCLYYIGFVSFWSFRMLVFYIHTVLNVYDCLWMINSSVLSS